MFDHLCNILCIFDNFFTTKNFYGIFDSFYLILRIFLWLSNISNLKYIFIITSLPLEM